MKVVLNDVVNHAKIKNKIALVDKDESLTYKEFLDKLVSFGVFLSENNVQKNDTVVVQCKHNIPYLVSMLGCHLYGAVFVPTEKDIKKDAINELSKNVNAKLVISDLFEDKYILQNIYNNLKIVEQQVIVPKEDDISDYLFTTGTTGTPVGIIHTFKSHYATAENLIHTVNMPKDNVTAITAPLNHAFAIRRLYSNLINGSKIVLIDGVFPPMNFFNMIKDNGVKSLVMVPSSMMLILKLTKDELSKYKEQLIYIEFATAPLTVEQVKHINSLLPNTDIFNVYGSTESGCVLSFNYTKEIKRKACIGVPTINAEILILDEKGNIITGNGKENAGFLASKGSMNMKGYYNNEEKTASVMKDGMIVTKDIIYRDDEGFHYFIGRDGDVINIGGLKVAPTEIEAIMMDYDGILDGACTSEANELSGSVPVALIVKKDDFDEKKYFEYMASKLEAFKIPRRTVYVTEIPRTYNGKILRRKLKELI